MTGYHVGASSAATSLPPWVQNLEQDLTPNVAISFNGLSFLQSGSAIAATGTGDFAIAVGRGTSASALDGTGGIAAAFGPGDAAEAGASAPILGGQVPDNNNVAVVVASDAVSSAELGNANTAIDLGLNDQIVAAAGGGAVIVATPFGDFR